MSSNIDIIFDNLTIEKSKGFLNWKWGDFVAFIMLWRHCKG